MTPFVTMRRALSDSHLLGAALGGDSWLAWRALLTAAMGEVLTDDARVIFAKLTGRGREPGLSSGAKVQPLASLKGLDIPSRRAVFIPWKPTRRRGFGMGNPTFR
jgi:hypothetical protein